MFQHLVSMLSSRSAHPSVILVVGEAMCVHLVPETHAVDIFSRTVDGKLSLGSSASLQTRVPLATVSIDDSEESEDVMIQALKKLIEKGAAERHGDAKRLDPKQCEEILTAAVDAFQQDQTALSRTDGATRPCQIDLAHISRKKPGSLLGEPSSLL